MGDEVLNLQLAGELEQQFLGAQQALLVADAACFQAVDQLVKLVFFSPIPGKRAEISAEVRVLSAEC